MKPTGWVGWAWVRLLGWTGLLTATLLGQETRPFQLGEQRLELTPATAGESVFLRGLRPLPTGGWSVDVVISNGAPRLLKGPVVLRFDRADALNGAPPEFQLDAAGRPFRDVAPLLPESGLEAGKAVSPFTVILPVTSGVPRVEARLYVAPVETRRLGVARTLDGRGLPIDGVEVAVGSGAPVRSGRGGWVTVPAEGTRAMVRFSKEGFLPVWREALGPVGSVVDLGSPRLVARAGDAAIALTAQSLPARLPSGWSPLAAVALTAPAGGTARLVPSVAVGADEVVAVVRWEEVEARWVILSTGRGGGINPVDVPLTSAGVVALVVADVVPSAPPVPTVGTELPGSDGVAPATSTWTATGKVDPSSRPAARDPLLVTARAEVDFRSTAGALTSGLTVRCEITEEYRLRDGTRRVLPRYETVVSGYQRPGAGAGVLRAEFPLRPFQLLAGEELSEAVVRVQVLASVEFAGPVLGAGGGEAVTDGIRVRAGAGDLAGSQAVALRVRSLDDLGNVALPGVATALFELDVAGVVPGRTLRADFVPDVPNQDYVLGRVIFDEGRFGIQPVARYRSDGTGLPQWVEPVSGGLAGIDGGGLHVLVRVGARQAVISGVAKGRDGSPAAGFEVRVGGWTAWSGTEGRYRLVAPAGATVLGVLDPATGDTGSEVFDVGTDLATVVRDLSVAARGPRVVRVSPVNGATDVSRVTPVELVFDEPVATARVVAAGAVQLLVGTNALPFSVSLSPARTVLTLLPTTTLPPEAEIVLKLARTITDSEGLPLEGPNEFRFVTETDRVRRTDIGLEIHEPLDGVARMVGGPGIADPRSAVILVNETTGETSTVVSRADGSFNDFIRAGVDDDLRAVLVNRNGTRTEIAPVKQIFRDGSVGLFATGGEVAATGETGEVRLKVEPGAVDGRVILKLEPMKVIDFTALVGGLRPPESGPFVGAFVLTESGAPLRASMDISFPVEVASLGLPAGVDPTNAVYGVVIPVQLDGKRFYQIVDTAVFVPEGPGRGRIVTQSPPFTGVLARKLAEAARGAGLNPTTPRVAETDINPHQGETAVFGILPLSFSQGLKVAGKVVSVRLDPSGDPVGEARPVTGAIVRVETSEAGVPGLFTEGDTLSVSDDTGHFGFFYRPLSQAGARALVATHPRFPFQTANTGGFATGGRATAVVTAELRFVENLLSNTVVEGTERPVLQISHVPVLPVSGLAEGDGATLTLVAVDDAAVGVPTLTVEQAVNARGETVAVADVQLVAVNPTIPVEEGGAEPAPVTRRVTQWKLRMKQAGRVLLKGTVADNGGRTDVTEYAVVFGGTRPVLQDPGAQDTFGSRVIFSWPPAGATNVPSLLPIRVRFNEPVPAEFLAPDQLGWIAFDAGHFLRRVDASSDRREITLWYDGDRQGAVRLTLGVGMTDQAGNEFDQDDQETGNQPFTLDFEQSGDGLALLGESLDGAGAVLLGRYAYVLDRRTGNGRLVAFDLQKPDAPVTVSALELADRPTALALVQGYELPKGVNAGTGAFNGKTTNDLIAVFTGSSTQNKRLRLVRVANGQMVSGPSLSLNGGNLTGGDGTGANETRADQSVTAPPTMVVQAKWDPPFLGYFELGADVTSVVLLNLTSFDVAAKAGGRLTAFPLRGTVGNDANGDNDYADAGDLAPLPMRDAFQPPGLAFSFAPEDPQERIQDFDFSSGLGLVVTAWQRIGTSPAAGLRVVLAATSTNDLANAVVTFPAEFQSKRVTLLPAQELRSPDAPPGSDDGLQVRDIALVSLLRLDGGSGALAVVDVTEPFAPVLRQLVPLPAGEGAAQTVQRRADGLLAVATAQSTLLLEARDLLLPANGDEHPAFRGRLDGVGNGVRAFVADVSGINVTYGGGRRQVVVSEPRFTVMRFPSVFDPKTVAEQPAAIAEGFLRRGSVVQVIEPTLPGTGAPTLDPSRNYYVLVDAPGGAADAQGRLKLALVAVDRQGRPQVEKGGTLVPAVVGDSQLESALLVRRVVEVIGVVVNFKKAATETVPTAVQRLGSLLRNGLNVGFLLSKLGAFGDTLSLLPPDFAAQRLSSDPNHPLYNRFLAGPFLVVGGAPTEAEVKAIVDQSAALQVTRPLLRPSPRLWVGLPSRRQTEITENPGALDRFAALFRLNPTLTLAGVPIPRSTDLVDAMAAANQSAPGSVASLLDLGDNAAVLVGALNSVPLLNMILKGDLQPTLFPGAHTLVRVNYNDRPLVLVPGFGASRLHIAGQERWLGGFEEILLNRLKHEMELRPDGTPLLETQVTDALRYALELGPAEVKSYYGDWIQHLKADLHYVEYEQLEGSAQDPTLPGRRRRLDGAPVLSQDPTPDLFVFPYDWRVDNQKSAEKLRDYVRLIREIHPDADGIDLVCHSNGGLLARAYLLLPGQRPLVKRFISVGTPWLGASKILAGVTTGELNDMSLNIAGPIGTFRRLLQFYPAGHQFLPAKELFALGTRPLIEDGQDVNTNGFGHQTFNFEQYLDVLGKHLLRESAAMAGAPLSLQPGGVHPAVANLTTFRAQAIADHRDDADDVEMHHIFGMGCTPDTIGQLRLLSRLVPVISTNNAVADSATGDAFEPEEDGKPPGNLVRFSDGVLPVSSNQFRLSKEVELRFVSGDGTVPIASLARGAGSGIDFNAPHAKVHPVIAGFGEKESGHNPMLNTPQFFRLFSDIITGRTVDHLTVQISAPIEPAEGSVGLFNFSATGAGPGAGELSWVVDYGDGTVELYRGAAAGSQTQQHRYRQSGTYTVSVGVTTDKTDSERARVTGFKSTQVTVRNVAPTVVLEGMPTTASAGDTVLVSARVTDPGTEDSFSYRWTLPGSRIEGRHQFLVPVTFGRPGTQTVKVEVEDQDGGIGTATASVTVQPAAPLAGPGFADHSQLPRSARPQSLPGFEGGQPEILVRIVGVAPIGEPTLETAALIVQNQRGLPALVDQALDLSRMVIVTALPSAGDPSVLLGAATESLDAIRTARDRFVGKFARDVEMIREVRERTTSFPLIGALAGLIGQDLSVKTTLIAGLPTNRPWMMDVLYLKGGEVQRLTRWSNSIASGVGFRLRWNWVTEQGQVEMVSSDGTLGPLIDAAVLSNAVPLFDTANPAMAADRLGPAVAGVLNPATDQIDLLARDNFTAANKLRLYLAFDANENGRLDDDLFYEMTTNRVDRSRLTARPFAILSQDEQGNIGDVDPFLPVRTQNFLLGDADLPEPQRYRARLNDVREAVRGAVSEGLSDPLTEKFLLDPAHLWVFEQGSGAGLWRSENLDAVVRACNRNYIPGKSDNDYELFFPASLGQPLGFNPAGRAAFLAQGPLRDETLTGDWYFVPPLGLDENGALTDDSGAVVRWLYRLPQGSALSDGAVEFEVAKVGPGQPLSAGFPAAFTPAEVIAQVMRAKVREVPARAKLLPDTTFYAERREHFMFGQAHLARPQAAGDDTLGDAGMGRQMLMLKWVLEGAFVTVPTRTDFNASLPLAPTAFLDAIHGNWVTAGVPLAEGYEWGVFQEYAALAARPTVRAALRFGTPEAPVLRRFADDAIAAQERGKIKKLGKAAIRAALARLAGDPELRGALTDIPPTAYRERGLQSFEEYILETIRGSEKARVAFGRLVEDLDDVTEPPDLGDWLRAKQGHDEGYVQLLLADPALHRRYVAATFDFLRRTVQTPTQPHHEAFIQSLVAAGKTDELALRLSNLHRVVNGAPGQPGIRELARALRLDVDLPVEVSSWGPGGFTGVDVQLRDADGEGAGGSGAAPRRGARPLLDSTLGTGIALTAFEEEALGNESGEALAVVSEEGIPTTQGEPVVEMTLEGNPVQASKADDAYAVTMERMPVGEPVVAPKPFFALFVAGPNRTTMVLDDWPAAGVRPRSPGTTIGLADRIEILIFAAPGLTGLQAELSSESSPNRIQRPLAETVAGSGVYEIASGQTPVRVTLSRTDSARLYVPDENLVRVQVTGPSMPAGGLIEEVMVDASELAIATVKHTDRGPELKPRFDYRDQLTGSPQGPRMFLQAFNEFDDNVAAVVGNGDNAMRQMLQNFAGAQFPDSGEADWLYLHAHGTKDGRILDHNQVNNGPSGRILAPVPDLALDGRWNKDADYFISEACSILNPGIDRNGNPITGQVAGKVNWELVMRSSPRPIHAILGFIFAKVASRADTLTFINAMKKGQEIGLSWFRSMDGVQREWGILYFVGTEPDSLYRMTQDRGPLEPIDFISYRGTVGDDLGDDLEETVAGHELWPGLWAPAGFAASPEIPGTLPAWRGARWNPGLNPGSGERLRIRDLGDVLEFGQPRLPGALDEEAPAENLAQLDAERFLQSHSPAEAAAWQLDRAGRILASRSEVTGRTEDKLVARQFHFRRQLDGIPVHGSRASIEIRAGGVFRGSSVRAWTPVTEAGPMVEVQPMGWCLERWWRDEGPPDPRRVSRGELVWAPVRTVDGTVRLVPAWCFRMTGADATGRAVGEWVDLILDARTGRGMEAEVLP